MNEQRYVAILADEMGNIVTPKAEIAKLVQGARTATRQRRAGYGSSVSTRPGNTKGKGMTVSERIKEQGFEDSVVRAILRVESGGQGIVDGRVVVRFEPHVFLRWYTKKTLGQSDTSKAERIESGKTVLLPGMVVKTNAVREKKGTRGTLIVSNMYVNHVDARKRFTDGVKRDFAAKQDVEYAALNLAASIDRELAYMSTSFGSGQIMGFNHSIVGYSSAYAMYEAFNRSEELQELGMLDFLINYKRVDKATGLTLAEAVREGNFEVVAKLYNGDTSGTYSARMLAAHDSILKRRRTA